MLSIYPTLIEIEKLVVQKMIRVLMSHEASHYSSPRIEGFGETTQPINLHEQVLTRKYPLLCIEKKYAKKYL
jgi:hypothetical protein